MPGLSDRHSSAESKETPSELRTRMNKLMDRWLRGRRPSHSAPPPSDRVETVMRSPRMRRRCCSCCFHCSKDSIESQMTTIGRKRRRSRRRIKRISSSVESKLHRAVKEACVSPIEGYCPNCKNWMNIHIDLVHNEEVDDTVAEIEDPEEFQP